MASPVFKAAYQTLLIRYLYLSVVKQSRTSLPASSTSTEAAKEFRGLRTIHLREERKKTMAAGKGRANYFYCVRVTNPEICNSIQDALEWIVDKEPQYRDFCYSKEMLHVTLCEVGLETDEDVQRASAALTSIEDLLRTNLPQTKLRIKGITTFFNKVMVGDVEYDDSFRIFAELLTSEVKQAGVNVVQRHEFRPHMTIMKVTSMKARKAKVEDINPWLYVNMKDKHFGDQKVNSVHLCKMGYERRSDGFYKTPAEIIFSRKEESQDDT